MADINNWLDSLEGFGEPEKKKTGFVSDIKRGAGQIISGAGSTLRDVGAEGAGERIEKYGTDIIRANPSSINTFLDVLENPGTTVREAVGEVIPQVGGVIGGRVVGGILGLPFGPGGVAVGQTVGSLVSPFVTSYGGIRSDQRESGQEDIGRALMGAIPATALERFGGAERVASKVLGQGTDFLAREAGTSLLKNVVKQGARGFIEESLTEVPQSALERFGAFKDLTSPEALDEYAVSGIKGGFGGAAIRGGLGAVAGERQPGSLLGGSNDLFSGGGSPDTDSIRQAINTGSGLSTSDLINQVTGVSRPKSQNDAASMEAALNEKTGIYVPGQNQIERELTAGDLAQINAGLSQPAANTTTVPGATPQPGAQQTPGGQQAQAVDPQEIIETGKIYGVTPVADLKVPTWQVAGVRLYSPQAVQKFLSDLAVANKEKSSDRLAIESALVVAGLVKINQANAKTLLNAVNKQLEKYQIANAQTVADAAEIINDQIKQLAIAGKGQQDTNVTNLAQAYEALTGQEAPAYDLTQQTMPKKGTNVPKEGISEANSPIQTQGVTNDGQEQQVPTGLGAVSEPSGTSQSTGGTNVRPNVVQPQQSGSLPEGSLGLQVDQRGEDGTRPGAGNAVGAPVSGGSQNQQTETVNGSQVSAGASQAPNVEGQAGTAGQAVGATPDGTAAVSQDNGPAASEEGLTAAKQLWEDMDASGTSWEQVPRVFQEVLAKAIDTNTPVTAEVIDAILLQIEASKMDDAVQEVLNRAFNRLFPMDKQKKKGSFILRMLGTTQANRDETVKELAIDYEISEGTIKKDWNKAVAEMLGSRREELARAIKLALVEMRLDATQTLETIQAIKEKMVVDGEQIVVDLADLQIDEDGQAGDPDVKVKNRTSASVQEVFNKNETINAKYLRLSKSLEDAENDGDQEQVTKLEKELAELAEQAAGKKAVEPEAKTEEKPKRAKKVVKKVEPKEEKPATAQEAWDKVASQYPNAPKWADLTEDQQKTFTEYGPDNWTEQDVQNELIKLAKSEPFNVQRLNFQALEGEPGVDAAMQQFKDAGVEGVVDLVDQYQLLPESSDADGQYDVVNGKTVVKFKSSALEADSWYSGHIVRHEFAHVVDEAAQGGIYSSQPQMALANDGRTITPIGSVAREVYKLYKADPQWRRFLSYPFNETKYPADRMQAEMFAQLWSIYLDPELRQDMMAKAPIASAYMKEVVAHAKRTIPVRLQEKRASQSQAQGRVVRNEGQRNERSQGVSQGAFAVKAGTAKEVINRLPPQARSQVQQILDTIKDLAKKALPTFAFTQDLADMAEKYLPSARKFVDLFASQQAIKTRYELQVARILNAYNRLPSALKGTGPNSVNKFLKDSTISGKWGYKIKADSNVTLDPDLKARFEAFPKEAQEVIKAVFKHGYDTLLDMKKAVMDNVNTEFDALIAAAKAAGEDAEVADLQAKKKATLTQYESLLSIAGKKPYAPLKRFGNYVVVGRSKAYLDAEKAGDRKLIEKLQKDENHYFVQFAETFGEAKAMEREESSRYALVQAFEKDIAADSIYGGNDLQQVFFRIKNLAKETFDDKTNQAAVRGINKLVNDLHLAMLAENAARQSENRRKNIAGADDDMMRAFATQGRATAHFIGSLHNTGQIYETLRQMKEEADDRTPGRDERRRYYNEFMKRHAMGFDYKPSPVLDKALAGTSFWMLLTNPAYYLQNLTQPLMMSVPYMAGKHGYGKTNAEFLKAYREVSALLKTASLDEKFDFSKLPEDVRDMMEELVKRGRIDISLEQDLGDWRSTEDTKFPAFVKTVGFLRTTAQKVEMINRVATAIAAYRLEKAGRSGDLSAINYADKVIRVTHGDYSGANAPRIMRSGLGRLATQFRKFQLIQISMMARLFNDAFKGATKKERSAAKQALLWTLTHAGVAGGIMGLPGFYAAAAVFGALFGDEDEPENPELALRRLFGDDFGTLMTKGLPAALGVDVSGKIGMGQMLSVLPYADIDLSKKGWETAVTAAMGPFVGGLMPRAIDGLAQMGKGDYYKGLELLVPSGVANAMKGARFAEKGVTQRNGDVTLSADEISFLDATLQGLGLPTTKLTERQFRQGVQIEFEKFFNERTTELKRQYAKAYRNNDTAAMQEARDSWDRLQESRMREGFKRQPLSNLLKSPMEQVKRERNTAGGVQFNTGNRRFVEELPQ